MGTLMTQIKSSAHRAGAWMALAQMLMEGQAGK
jgi:hypothetical protein